MAQILQPYEVPVVHGDVSPNESLLDVFYSLEKLSSTIDDIFSRVERRVDNERSRLDQINARVGQCSSKVESIRGSKSATTVFSTSKFPAPKALPAYPTLFSQISPPANPVHREAEDDVRYMPPEAKRSLIGNLDATEENMLLLGRINTYGSDMERVEFIMEDEGLGPVPQQVEYVGSLLLFNSSINPYKNYQTLDNLVSSGRTGKETLLAAKALASAPKSMLGGDALPDVGPNLDLTFKPEMGEMASLALPSNLPLDFLADLSYEGVALPSIAPSAAKANYDLPQITAGSGGYSTGPTAKEASLPLPVNDTGANSSNATGNASGAGAPPPPPSGAAAPPPPPSAARAPPPPPGPAAPTATAGAPPPPVPAITASAAVDVDSDSEEEEDNSAGNALLASIRGMGKLRKASEREVKEVKKTQAASKPTMFDEMKLRMGRRNNALTGKESKAAVRRESLAVQQAQAAHDSGINLNPPTSSGVPPPPRPSVAFAGGTSDEGASTSRAAPPPPAARPKSMLLNMGFQNIAEDGNEDSDEDAPMPARSYNDDFSSDESDASSMSDMSEESIQISNTKKPFIANTKKQVASPSPAPAPAPSKPVAAKIPMPVPKGDAVSRGRRGSLLDEDNEGLAKMLAVGQSKVADAESSDGSDDDWD